MDRCRTEWSCLVRLCAAGQGLVSFGEVLLGNGMRGPIMQGSVRFGMVKKWGEVWKMQGCEFL